jgi:hypothetical protein
LAKDEVQTERAAPILAEAILDKTKGRVLLVSVGR